jgi:hypothetical protein
MRWLVVTIFATALLGCASSARKPPPQFGVDYSPELDAEVHVPLGWTIQRFDDTNRYRQRVWVSPSGQTSYGVIRFSLPIPVGNEIALIGFLAQMRRDEGDANLLSKQADPVHNRLLFTAEGGRYHLDGIIVTRGFHGWVVYGGSLRNQAQAVDELELAVQARENTRLGPSLGPSGNARHE